MDNAILKTQANSTNLSPNISLKESSKEDSQISSNDETSLNNNIELCSIRIKNLKLWSELE